MQSRGEGLKALDQLMRSGIAWVILALVLLLIWSGLISHNETGVIFGFLVVGLLAEFPVSVQGVRRIVTLAVSKNWTPP